TLGDLDGVVEVGARLDPHLRQANVARYGAVVAAEQRLDIVLEQVRDLDRDVLDAALAGSLLVAEGHLDGLIQRHTMLRVAERAFGLTLTTGVERRHLVHYLLDLAGTDASLVEE